MRIRSLAIPVVLGLVVGGLAPIASGAPAGRRLVGLLNGHDEVDADGNHDNGDPDAAGYVVASIDGDRRQVCITDFRTAAVDGTITLFHIHKGNAGTNGPIVVDFGSLLPDGTGCVPVDDRRLLSDIQRSPDKFYFNVHSTPDFPGGAIRGQIQHLARR